MQPLINKDYSEIMNLGINPAWPVFNPILEAYGRPRVRGGYVV
jgi:hypothetical protein